MLTSRRVHPAQLSAVHGYCVTRDLCAGGGQPRQLLAGTLRERLPQLGYVNTRQSNGEGLRGRGTSERVTVVVVGCGLADWVRWSNSNTSRSM